MKTKLLLSAEIAVLALGLGITVFLGKTRQNTAPPPSPPEAFLGQLRGELNGVAAGDHAALPPSTVRKKVAAVSSTKEITTSAPIVWNCTGADAGNFDCYDAYYTKLTTDGSIAAAFDDLKARYNTDDYARAECHPLTHVIGRAASEKFATPGEAFTKGDNFCWSGYYHGVLEGIVGRIGLKNLPGQMDSICADIKAKSGYSFDYYNCVHGLGHGVMALTQDELFDSLTLCDKLTGSWEQLSCGSGAFMENIIVDGKNHKTKYLNPQDPLYPCDASPEQYKNTCYLMQTSYMLKINNRDFKQTFAWCSAVDPAYRDTCYRSLGRDASGQSTSGATATRAICLLGADREQQSNCVIGAVKDFISYFHSDVQAKQFCDSFTDPDLQKTCLDNGAAYYSEF